MQNSFQVLAFDPGGATGWAHVIYNGEWEIYSGTYWKEEHHQEIVKDINFAFTSDEPLTVITESFEFRQTPESANKRRGLELVSREYIGVMKLVCQNTNTPLIQQMPAHAKRFMTDEKLERVGYLTRPLHEHRHEHDALRHLFFYLISTKKVQYWRDKIKSATP